MSLMFSDLILLGAAALTFGSLLALAILFYGE